MSTAVINCANDQLCTQMIFLRITNSLIYLAVSFYYRLLVIGMTYKFNNNTCNLHKT